MTYIDIYFVLFLQYKTFIFNVIWSIRVILLQMELITRRSNQKTNLVFDVNP